MNKIMKTSKRIVVNGGKWGDSLFTLETEGSRGRDTQTLIRAGKKWNKPFQNSKSVKIVSDGNGLDVYIYRGSDDKDFDIVKLDYSEAEELGIALLEYTKSDPNVVLPLYDVFEKKVEPKKRKNKARRRVNNEERVGW